MQVIALLLFVAVSTASPVQTQFPTNFHVWDDWEAKNSIGGNLDSSYVLTDYNSAAYQCNPLIVPVPQDDPINSHYQPFELLRYFYNATNTTGGVLYSATMNGTSFEVTCSNQTIKGLPSWQFPTLPYSGQQVIDGKLCDVFSAANGTFNGQAYAYAQWAQAQSTGVPVQTMFTTAQRTDMYTYSEYIAPVPSNPGRFVNCNQSWIVQSCNTNALASCRVYRDVSTSLIAAAIGWVCGNIDCTPINPGGSHYLPNTPVAHADWAFTQYFYSTYLQQGISSCCFAAPGSTCIAAVAF